VSKQTAIFFLAVFVESFFMAMLELPWFVQAFFLIVLYGVYALGIERGIEEGP
jgi:Ca2+/Na+ antiporter